MRYFVLALFLTACNLTQTHGQELWARQTSNAAATGDSQCSQNICVAATVNGSSVEYVLSNTGRSSVGWMGIGFGGQMPNTPMVIMWSNSDGSITLSQRSALGFVMPTVDNNPPRIASLNPSLSSTYSNNFRFAFSIPANGDKMQDIIFALGATNPGSAAVDATLQQHIEFGTGHLDLTKQLPMNLDDSSESFGEDIPLRPYQRLVVAHAILCVIGFLVLLPAGALLARYFRTFTPTWFRGHWITQIGLAGPIITTGFILGIQAINEDDYHHLNDIHKRLGVVLYVLYVTQCVLGALIHWTKPKNIKHRPPQNYLHAIFGIFIIGLALYQVHYGYKIEWPKTTSRPPLPDGLDIIFWIWVALLPTAYVLGLGFLRKQYRQEHEAQQGDKRDNSGSAVHP